MKSTVMRSFAHKSIFALVLIFGSGLFYQTYGQQYNICNNGNQDVWVAHLRVISEFLWGDSWELSGWTKVSPGNALECRNPIYQKDGRFHIVYMIYMPGGGFGAVKYNFSQYGPNQLNQICVAPVAMSKQAYGKTPYTPPCPEGYFAVPVSNSVFLQGNSQLTITVTPTASDYLTAIPLSKPTPTPSSTATLTSGIQDVEKLRDEIISCVRSANQKTTWKSPIPTRYQLDVDGDGAKDTIVTTRNQSNFRENWLWRTRVRSANNRFVPISIEEHGPNTGGSALTNIGVAPCRWDNKPMLVFLYRDRNKSTAVAYPYILDKRKFTRATRLLLPEYRLAY